MKNSIDPLDNLEDIGYDGIVNEDEGYKKASSYLTNNEPLPAKTQAQLLEEYRALTRKPDVIGPDNEPVLGNDLLAKQDAMINQEVEDAAALEASLPDDSVSEMPPIENLLPPQESAPLMQSQKIQQSPLSSVKKQEELLSQYRNLLNEKNNKNTLLNVSRALGSAADAITISGGGTPVRSGIEDIISKQNDQVINDYLSSTKALDVENELQLNDPESDISKFARENAIAYARKAGLDEQVVSQLEGLSAKQLEKLGFKAQVSSAKSRVIDKNITNPETGKIEAMLFDEQGNLIKNLGEAGYSYGTNIDPVTGLPRLVSKSNPKAAPVSIPGSTPTTTPSAQETQPTVQNEAVQAPVEKQQEPEEYKSPTSLNKINPKLYEQFKKTQDEFVKDMKDSREVATSTTNLSAKLTPGNNSDKVDSGLLGGIQTQAAKMAGQKGVLTDQDLVKFAGAGGVAAAIDRITNGSMFGEMSNQDVQFFKAFAKKMNSSLQEDIQNRSKIYTEQVHNEAKNYLPGLSQDSVKNWMGVQNVAPAVQKNMIKVISPDGTPGSIPEEKLEKALKQGYKKVEENVK